MVHFVSEEVYGYGSLGVLEGERRAPLGADIDTSDEILSSGVLESWGPLGAGMDTFDEDLSSGVLAALSPSVVWGGNSVSKENSGVYCVHVMGQVLPSAMSWRSRFRLAIA